jgi:hypothetical protein
MFEGLGETFLCLIVQLSQAAREHLAHAFFQACPGEVRQRLARDGKNFLLGSAGDFVVETLLFAFQCVLLFGTQGVGRQPRFLEEALTFGSCLALRLAQERGALLVELVVLFWNLSRSFSASVFLASASASSLAIRLSRSSMAWRMGL